MKIILGAVFILMMLAGTAFSHPPTEMLLSYDKETKTLHVDIKHISDSLREHHIRRLIVYRNDEEAQDMNFNTQKPPGMDADVVVEAQPGDVLRVKAVCSEAGNKEQSLTVPEDDAAAENAPASNPPAEK